MTPLPRLLRAALAAADRGWPVHPLLPGSKQPALVGWPEHASVDPVVLTAWWRHAPYNVGISCGPAGLLVVDIDGGAEGRAVFARLARDAGAGLGRTFTVATPSGGRHRYYVVAPGRPARSTVGQLGRHVDTRGAGGYVVGAGSVRGRRHYRIVDPSPPVALPEWLAELLVPSIPDGRPVEARRRRSGYGAAALAGETEAVRAARPGSRNAVLFTAAVRLGTLAAAGVLDERVIHEQLRTAASAHVGRSGFIAGEAERAIANGLRYGRQRPRQMPGG